MIGLRGIRCHFCIEFHSSSWLPSWEFRCGIVRWDSTWDFPTKCVCRRRNFLTKRTRSIYFLRQYSPHPLSLLQQPHYLRPHSPHLQLHPQPSHCTQYNQNIDTPHPKMRTLHPPSPDRLKDKIQMRLAKRGRSSDLGGFLLRRLWGGRGSGAGGGAWFEVTKLIDDTALPSKCWSSGYNPRHRKGCQGQLMAYRATEPFKPSRLLLCCCCFTTLPFWLRCKQHLYWSCSDLRLLIS